jgi:hypothetical protein
MKNHIMHKLILAAIMLVITASANVIKAQPRFDECFADSTLRLDYIFSGNASHQKISVDKLCLMPRWYGKKAHLDELPMEGNGQITVRDAKTNAVIYRNSFSTLFQEWLTYDEAKHVDKAFENVFLIPMPKNTVKVTVDLMDNRRQVMCSMTHTVVPNDILIRHIGFSHVTPYTTIQAAKDTTKCIHIAYVAEGYTEEEMDVFLKDVKFANEAMFSHEPFKELRDRFNVVAVCSPSAESGTSEPSKGVWKSTAFGSHFDTFYSDRYLTTLNLKDLHNVLAGTPYEHIIVLVNTSEYGGGGILNSYNLSMTHHPLFQKVVVHEFGHSFAGLADEYAYEQEQLSIHPLDIEPWEPNITSLVNFKGKWENLLPKKYEVPTPVVGNKKKIGLYEGAGYQMKGMYRGQEDCRMRSNNVPYFCTICQNHLRNLIRFYTE